MCVCWNVFFSTKELCLSGEGAHCLDEYFLRFSCQEEAVVTLPVSDKWRVLCKCLGASFGADGKTEDKTSVLRKEEHVGELSGGCESCGWRKTTILWV